MQLVQPRRQLDVSASILVRQPGVLIELHLNPGHIANRRDNHPFRPLPASHWSTWKVAAHMLFRCPRSLSE